MLFLNRAQSYPIIAVKFFTYKKWQFVVINGPWQFIIGNKSYNYKCQNSKIV